MRFKNKTDAIDQGWVLRRFLAVALLMDFAGATVSFPVPWIAERLGANPLELGIAAASWSVTYTTLSMVFGRCTERWGFKRMPLLALGLLITLSCLMPATDRLYLVIVEALGMGACFAMFWTPLITWLSGFVGSSGLGTVMSRFSIAWNAGAMVGLLLSGKLYEWAWWLPFGVGIVLCLIVGWLLLPIPAAGPFAGRGHSEEVASDSGVSQTFLYLAWSANLLTWSAVAMVAGLLPELAKEVRFSPTMAGVLLFISCAARVGILLSLQWRIGWQTQIRSLILAEGVLAFGLLSVAETRHLFWLALGMFSLGIASGMTYLISVYASLNARSRPGRNVGLHETFLGAGSLLGPTVGGAIAKVTDIRTPYRSLLGLVIGVILLQWLSSRLQNRKNERDVKG